MITYRWILLRMRNLSHKFCRENQNTHFVFNIFFFRKSYLLSDNVGKYCRAGYATDDNMAHARWILDNWGYRHTLRKCNTYWFFPATMVMHKRLDDTFYVHWLSFYLLISTTWCAKFYNNFISSLYMFRAQVLIVRRAKLYYTASGIIILKQVSGLKLLK